jgi:hypothetical protein
VCTAVVEALALRLSVAAPPVQRARLAWRGSVGGLHGGEGGVRYGPVKEHLPMRSFGWRGVSLVSMAEGELSRLGIGDEVPSLVHLAMAVGSGGEP